MKALDMMALGMDNLRRSKLRTFLTTLGVVIGIGALTSMISLGTGIQKNITETFRKNDLFTSMTVTSRNIDIGRMAGGDPDAIRGALSGTGVPLTDSTVEAISQIPGVDLAFPEIRFPVKTRMDGRETRTQLQALPCSMGSRKPYDRMMAGRFFADDTSRSLVVRPELLRELGILFRDQERTPRSGDADTTKIKRVVHPDSLIGDTLEIVSAALNTGQLLQNPMLPWLGAGQQVFKESATRFAIGGILERSGAFGENQFGGGIIVPMGTVDDIPRLGFSSVWELLGNAGQGNSYQSIYVRARSMKDLDAVRNEIERTGLHVFSITDQLEEIKRGFYIMDAILGAIGTIALVVAALGIINTMVMSILERTREIGIMKAIGGSEEQIRLIFFIEAGTIGLLGALFGLMLGWVVTRIANLVANARFLPPGEPRVDFFYFPAWLIFGAIAFAIIISLAAGLYPANRAARVNPIDALRHD